MLPRLRSLREQYGFRKSFPRDSTKSTTSFLQASSAHKYTIRIILYSGAHRYTARGQHWYYGCYSWPRQVVHCLLKHTVNESEWVIDLTIVCIRSDGETPTLHHVCKHVIDCIINIVEWQILIMERNDIYIIISWMIISSRQLGLTRLIERTPWWSGNVHIKWCCFKRHLLFPFYTNLVRQHVQLLTWTKTCITSVLKSVSYQ